MFTRTSKKKGMWRGWLKNGQAVEITWGKTGWEFGGGVHIHSNDEDEGDRMLFLKVWRLIVVLPLGIIKREYVCGDEPQWSAYTSSEFGLTFHWGQRRRSYDWPWDWHTLAYEQQIIAGDEDSWVSVFDWDGKPDGETHPYTYTLRNGTVQERTATISKRRHILTYRAFKRIGWPKWIKESIDVEFSDEVGERSGSWKGGTIGCGYDMRPGETMEQTLRRMERERKF
jgi:hypothetical protein